MDLLNWLMWLWGGVVALFIIYSLFKKMLNGNKNKEQQVNGNDPIIISSMAPEQKDIEFEVDVSNGIEKGLVTVSIPYEKFINGDYDLTELVRSKVAINNTSVEEIDNDEIENLNNTNMKNENERIDDVVNDGVIEMSGDEMSPEEAAGNDDDEEDGEISAEEAAGEDDESVEQIIFEETEFE
ncbi:MAG: hypothetical protein ABJH98_17750 [Reichenbachiella sp.]|uniref:hypothetical protein n=1 Tax=Reichenbachiella sp. TaxID=2184521 RepID=UPI0032998273